MKVLRFSSLVFLAGFTLGFEREAQAIQVLVKNVADDQPAGELGFGVLKGSVSHHAGPQYLEVTQTESIHRKVFLYTDNGTAFGKPEAGLVSEGTLPPLPLFFRNFVDRPAQAPFTPAEEPSYTLMLERSAPDFSAQKDPLAKIAAGPGGVSWVYFGVTLPPDARGGGFQARMVVEETSEVDDTAGPLVAHAPFNDLILTQLTVGLQAAVTDDSTVVGSTLYYRMEGAPTYTSRAASLAIDPQDPFRWTATAELIPGVDLTAPGVLEYYFTAVDTFTNTGQSPVYKANLYPSTTEAEQTLTTDGGTVDISIGDPRLPGVEMQFPSGSVSRNVQVTVALRGETDVPPYENQAPVRAFELGPDKARFQRPVTLALPYLDQDQDGTVDGTAINEMDLRIFWYDVLGWRYVGGRVDPLKNQVQATVTHFSYYALFPSAQPPSADAVRPKERILTASRAITFDTDAGNGDFEIEFFDIRGTRVRHLRNENAWDGRDDNGHPVESGTYVYRFVGQGMTLTGMVAVAR